MLDVTPAIDYLNKKIISVNELLEDEDTYQGMAKLDKELNRYMEIRKELTNYQKLYDLNRGSAQENYKLLNEYQQNGAEKEDIVDHYNSQIFYFTGICDGIETVANSVIQMVLNNVIK